MQNNTNINITYSDEEENEEDESPIINNNDEFGIVNEVPQKQNNKSICNINKLEHHRAKSKKINDNFKINTPKTKLGIPHMNLYSLLLKEEDNISLDNKNKLKKCKIKQKKQNSKMKKNLDTSKKNGKSVFIKISEDIYTKFKSKPNKEVRDINKMEEDAYNKMTSEDYLETCKNRENVKNRKIVQDFLDRKAKEDTFKKIGIIECDKKDEMKKLQDPKRALSVTDRNINFKSTRTLAQFLQDQKNNIDRKKNKNNKKIPKPIKGNILPEISKYNFSEINNDDAFSEFSKNSDISNFDIIGLQYENESFFGNNDKFKESEEKEKINKTFEMEKEVINPGVNFTLTNKKNTKKKQENSTKTKNNINFPKQKQNIKTNEKKEKKEKNLKESCTTTTSKKSTENITKKFLNLYKDTLMKNLGQKYENEFDINYPAFLLILYNVGFTNKNYSIFIENSELEIDKQSFHSKEISDFSISSSSLNMSEISDKKNLKFCKKDSAAGKSLEDEAEKYRNTFKYDKEFQLSKDAWKIITEKQNFDEEMGISSKKVFLFYISVLGLCKEEKSEKLLKKECPFFFGDKKLMQQYNNSNIYINKYFGLYKINAMDNLLMPEKREKIITSNTNSLITSFTVSNLDSSSNNKKYDIYEKNYNNKNNIKKNKNIIDDDTNSIRLFNAGIKKEKQFYYDNKNKDKSSKSIISLTDIDHADNNSINLLNNSISDNSSFWDLKKIFRENPIEKKEDDSDELDVDSFLLEDNNNNYFHYSSFKDKNSYNEIKSYIQDDDENNNGKKNTGKKIIKYVFEIIIEDKPQKLIIRRGDNKNNIINDFCKKYGLDDIEKYKLLQVIDERLKNYNNKIKKNT